MINLSILKTELTTDPLGLGYNGDDRHDSELMNATQRDVPRTVAVKDILEYLSKQVNGSGATLRYTLDMLREYATAGTVRGASAGETGPEARRSAANMILMMLQIGPDAVFQVDDTNIQTAFQSLEGANSPNVLTAAQLSGLAALAKESGTRSYELFKQAVAPHECADARRS